MFPQALAYWRSNQGPFHGKREYPWLDYLERKLGLSSKKAPSESSEARRRTPYTEVAQKLLQNAAVFFRNLARDNAGPGKAMNENAAAFEKVADLIGQNPNGVIEPLTGAQQMADGSTSTKALRLTRIAANLLRDAANLFSVVAQNNPVIADMMRENAASYSELADSLERDPTGTMA
jgi:hypothetical protein